MCIRDSIRKRLGRGTLLNTCAKFQGLTLKTAWTLEFCAVKRKNHGLASSLLGFSVFSISGVKLDLTLVLRIQFFEYLREPLYKHALEHLEAARPEKKGHFVFFLR